jgi:hypothetical protein
VSYNKYLVKRAYLVSKIELVKFLHIIANHFNNYQATISLLVLFLV